MSKKLRQEIRPCDEDEIANELANFFFGLWQKGYRHFEATIKENNQKIIFKRKNYEKEKV